MELSFLFRFPGFDVYLELCHFAIQVRKAIPGSSEQHKEGAESLKSGQCKISQFMVKYE